MSSSVVAIIQARLTSSRLPRKVLAEIGRWTALELMRERLALSQELNSLVYVVPDTNANDELANYLTENLGENVVRGSENDVLSRFKFGAEAFPADWYVRLTGDCPLVCPEIVDAVIRSALETRADYTSNVDPPTYPDGFDVEVVSHNALTWLDANIHEPHVREHVTYGLRLPGESAATPSTNSFLNPKTGIVSRDGEDDPRLTLDDPEDLVVFRRLASHFGDGLITASAESIESAYRNLNLGAINGKTQRNAGLIHSKANYK